MRKLIAAINMTLDGFCDHTTSVADDQFHQHYTELLRDAGVLLYGRITYELMEYWPKILKNPTGNKSIDEFAVVMDQTPKIVFSRTLKHIEWKSARLAEKGLEEEVVELKQQEGKDIFVGSRSLIVSLLNLNLIDELQLCIQPIIAGGGLPLFDNINRRNDLRLVKSKLLKNTGSMILYYEPK